MKKKKHLVKAVLLLGIGALAIWGYQKASIFLAQDSCLDAGGSWNAKTCSCEQSNN